VFVVEGKSKCLFGFNRFDDFFIGEILFDVEMVVRWLGTRNRKRLIPRDDIVNVIEDHHRVAGEFECRPVGGWSQIERFVFDHRVQNDIRDDDDRIKREIDARGRVGE